MYRIEWIWLLGPIGALTLLITPWVGATLAVLVVLLVAVAVLVALVGAVVAMPFLLVRAVRRHLGNGRALPANTAQPTTSRTPRLTAAGAAGRQVPAPKAPAGLAR